MARANANATAAPRPATLKPTPTQTSERRRPLLRSSLGPNAASPELESDGCTAFPLSTFVLSRRRRKSPGPRRVEKVRMISGRRDDPDRGPLVWAFVASLLLHALLLPFSGWNWIVRLSVPRQPATERVVASTSVRIDRRSIPIPRSVSASHTAPQVRAAAAQRALTPIAPRPSAAPRHEFARERPDASPQPESSVEPTPGEPAPKAQPVSQTDVRAQLATQEQTFAHEAEELRAADNPLSLALPKRQTAAAFHRSYFDVAGHKQENAVQIQLIPLRHWSSGTTICYYARYVAQFATGAGEDGTIPWPVCYPIGNDRIANPPYVHDVPLPLPPAGYVLPSGTYLTPLLTRIYAERGTSR
jgi:hypothetical protein